MTRIRKLALWISDFVVRYASPGCKEWAEGLAREVEFIENDWSALAWSLGSTRVLLDRREAPLASLDEVPAAAQKFVDSVRINTVAMWIPTAPAPLYLWEFFFRAKSFCAHAGCALCVFSALLAGIFLLIEPRRLKNQPADETYNDIVACTLFYKSELERRSYTFFIQVAAMIIYLLGVTLADWNPWDSFALDLYCSMFAVSIPVYLYEQRKYRLRIQRLDALLAERS